MSEHTRRWCLHACAAALVAMAGVAVGAQAKDPAIGTWKLNVAKSTFSPGPAAKELTVTIEEAGPGRKVSVEGVGADGTPIKWGFTGNFDRKDVPITGSNPDADVVSLRRVSDNATRSTYKKAGKQTVVSGASVSADGKTLTVATTGENAKGQTVKNSLVFDREK